MYKYIIISIALFSLWSCNEEVANNFKVKPSAIGRLNQIEVIADDSVWEGPIGDTLNFYFGSAYPIMPSPEAIFDLRHFTPNDLFQEPLRKELRTYIVLADLQDDNSATTKMIRQDLGEERFLNMRNTKDYSSTVGKDKWARKQILIYIMGNGPENLYKSIRENFPAIAKRINKHDEEQLLASIYAVKRTNPGHERLVKSMYGVDMSVPGDFRMAVEDKEKNILWLRRDDNKGAILNIMMKRVDYMDQSQFEVENIKQAFNTLSGEYVKTSTPGSRMVINDTGLPVYDYTYEIDGMYTKELRGVWEMTEDFNGGPFVGYAIHQEESKSILYIYAFIYRPGKPKRNLMQQLDLIVKNIKVATISES